MANNERNESCFEHLQETLNDIQRNMAGWSRGNNEPMQQDGASPMEEASTVEAGTMENWTWENK